MSKTKDEKPVATETDAPTPVEVTPPPAPPAAEEAPAPHTEAVPLTPDQRIALTQDAFNAALGTYRTTVNAVFAAPKLVGSIGDEILMRTELLFQARPD